jgi:HPt (histidine-containing phosphotransfer) domain-containing protein
MDTQTSATNDAARHEEATLDRSVLAELRGVNGNDDADFATVLIDQFIADAASQVEQIRHAADCGDAGTLQALAHSLRGSASMLGANRLAALCAQMERDADAGGAPAAAAALVLGQEFTTLRSALYAERQGTGPL